MPLDLGLTVPHFTNARSPKRPRKINKRKRPNGQRQRHLSDLETGLGFSKKKEKRFRIFSDVDPIGNETARPAGHALYTGHFFARPAGHFPKHNNKESSK